MFEWILLLLLVLLFIAWMAGFEIFAVINILKKSWNEYRNGKNK